MSVSMKSLHKKHQCYRQRCLGDAKDYQNYLDPHKPHLHPHPPPIRPKRKSKKPNTTRSQHSVNQLLVKNKHKPSKVLSERSELQELKRRNEDVLNRNAQLADQLQQKSRKVNDLKHKIKDYQGRIRGYEQKVLHLQSVISESEHPKSPISLQKPQTQHLIASYQQQLKTFQTNQKAMFQHLQKYRVVQRQYQQYRNDSQRKLQRLVRQNQQLRQIQSNDKDYDCQIDSLRKELHKISIQQGSPQMSSSIHDPELTTLKSNNKQLLTEREHLICKIEEQALKQGELRHSLQAINQKVQKWGQQYKSMQLQRRQLEERCQHLQLKLQQKKQKNHDEKEQWARIFKDLMHQIEKLKKQIGHLQKSNQKLISLTSEQDE